MSWVLTPALWLILFMMLLGCRDVFRLDGKPQLALPTLELYCKVGPNCEVCV